MSDQKTEETKSTPVKQGSPKAAPASSPGEKSLNVNAKSFVPKMDSGATEQPAAASPGPATGAANTTRPPPMMPPPGMPGMPPPGFPGFMPGMHPGMMPPGFPPQAMPGKGMPMGMMPPPLGVPPSPVQGGKGPGARPMAPGAFMPGSPMMGGGGGMAAANGNAPTTPLTPAVSVGNATLVAKRSTAPPKFGCVLLAGVTGVGKTSIGNNLVQELSGDKIEWKFFCGADHLKDAPTAKPAPWDTTKSVFDGLGEYLDALLAKQTTHPIRGLLIDKQLRGVEDLYYLTCLLRSKGLLLWGVLGMDCGNDDILSARLGNTPGLNEKIKFHRVIYSRIQEASKAVGLWRTVDASSTKADSLKHLRTMVLGCSSQSPTKQFNANVYHDSPIPMVDNYVTYASVMASLFTIIPRNAKGVAMFPGCTTYTPLALSQLDAKKNTLKDYAVRRKVDGTKYVLYYDGVKLFLIPRHMRCVFEMSQDAWLGVHLSNTGKFVVDGELVKTSKDRSKEKLVVYDVIYWAEKGSATNLVARATWKERQERLKTNLCSEVTAFFPKKGDTVVVHQTTVDEPRLLGHLLEPTDYPCDGLIFHCTTRRDEPPQMWRPPEAVTVDFRLGAASRNEEGGWVFVAEVFDTNLAKYNQFRTDSIEITGGYRPTTIEGAIVACSLDLSGTSPSWIFQRVRSDLIASSLKLQVDEVLKHCMVPKQSMLDYVAALETRYNKEHGKTETVAPTAGGATNGASPPGNKQPTLGGATQPAAQATGAKPQANRLAFGSALAGPGGAPPEDGAAPSMRDVVKGDHKKGAAPREGESSTTNSNKDDAMQTDAQKLANVVANIKVKNMSSTPTTDVAMLTGMVGSVSVVPPEGKKSKNDDDDDGDAPKKSATRGQRECSECHETKHGRIDKRNNKVYCYDCWALEGVEFCVECKDFASGHCETMSRRKKGDFYCDVCWEKFDEEEAEEERKQKKRDSGRRDGGRRRKDD